MYLEACKTTIIELNSKIGDGLGETGPVLEPK